jgi:plasmid stabilization system protein ParE
VKKAVRPSPFAKAEIEYYLVRYESESARLRDRLWDDIEAVINLISEYPLVGEVVRRTGGRARRFPLDHFPFFLIYREQGDDLQIVALAHKSRKPNYWRPRLKLD